MQTGKDNVTKSRKFNKKYAEELLSIAFQDLETAKALLPVKGVRKENILFHIEQSVEKGMKAVLCKLEIAVPLVHELSIILDKIPEKLMPPRSDEISDLTQFATIRRYEEGKSEFSDGEVRDTYALAEEILSWAAHICKKG